MIAERMWCPPSPRNVRLKPILAERAMERGYNAEALLASAAAAEAQRKAGHIKKLTAQSLEVANARHALALREHNAATEEEYERLQKQSAAVQADTGKVMAEAAARDRQVASSIKEKEEQRQGFVQKREQAVNKVQEIRNKEQKQLSQMAQAHENAKTLADQHVEGERHAAAKHLAKLAEDRAQLQAALEHNSRQAAQEAQDTTERFRASAEAARFRSEVTRDRAATTVELAGAKAQATRTQAQLSMQKTEEKAKTQVEGLLEKKLAAQVKCDREVRVSQGECAATLIDAHDQCEAIREELAQEVLVRNRAMQECDRQAKDHVQEVVQQIHDRERERLDHFVSSQGEIVQTVNEINEKRKSCEDELAEVEEELRRVQEESRTRAKDIFRKWTEGSQAAEASIQDLERRGSEAVSAMEAEVQKTLDACRARKTDIMEKGKNDVKTLEQRALEVIDTTDGNLKDARVADEEATAAARRALAALKREPLQIQAATDESVQEEMDRAAAREEELQRDAAERIAAARAAAAAARQEEEELRAKTAEAWARLRAGCFELRRLNLHDFAQEITSGVWDLAPDRQEASGEP